MDGHCENYIQTAVKDNKKPYTSFGYPNEVYSMDDISENIWQTVENSSVQSIIVGKENFSENGTTWIYVCKDSIVEKLYDLDKVFDIYEKLTVPLSVVDNQKIRELSKVRLDQFSNPYIYDYYEPLDDAELVFTGLLLGYPLESTASHTRNTVTNFDNNL